MYANDESVLIMLMSCYEYSVCIHLHAERYSRERVLRVSWLSVDVAMETPELITSNMFRWYQAKVSVLLGRGSGSTS